MNFDSTHRLFVANAGSNTIEVFTQPILNGAVPSFTLATSTTPSNVALDSTGNAVVAEDRAYCRFCPFGVIQVFTQPISQSSTGTYGIDGGYFTVSVAFNANGNLWTEMAYYSYSTPNRMTEYRTPLGKKQGTPIQHFDLDVRNDGPAGLAFDAAGNMYAPTQNGLEVYHPRPWRKAFTIKASVSGGCLAFGPNGNLYVTTDNGRLLVFSPPFSATSMPRVTLHLPGGSLDAGVAIGP